MFGVVALAHLAGVHLAFLRETGGCAGMTLAWAMLGLLYGVMDGEDESWRLDGTVWLGHFISFLDVSNALREEMGCCCP